MALCGSTTACCVCVSLRQTAGMCQRGDEWSRGRRGLWTSCTVGLTCTAGLAYLRANLNSYMRFMSRRQGCLALTRRKDAAALKFPVAKSMQCEMDHYERQHACVIPLQQPLCSYSTFMSEYLSWNVATYFPTLESDICKQMFDTRCLIIETN